MSQLGDGWEGTRTAFLLCEELEQRILQYSWLWHSRVLLLGNRKHDQPSDILLFSPVLLHLSTNAPGDSEPAWPQGLLRIWGACKGCVCVWSTPWQHHSGSQARIDLFQLTEMRGKDQNMLSPLTQGCCISHHSPCAQQSCLVYSFWLPPTRYNGTENCLVSLKLIFSTKVVLPFFFCFPFSRENFYHTCISFLCWKQLLSALRLLFSNIFSPFKPFFLIFSPLLGQIFFNFFGFFNK